MLSPLHGPPHNTANYKPKTCKQCEHTIPATKRGAYCSDECKRTARRAQDRARYAKNREDNLKRAREYRQTHKEQCAAATKRWRERNKEYISECNRQWRKENPELARRHRDKWKAKNPDALAEYKKKWANAHRTDLAARRRKKYLANKDEIQERNRRWKVDNPDKVAAYVHRRAQLELEGNASDSAIREKWESSDKTCILCGKKIPTNLPPLHPKARTIEHLTPLHRGGRHDIDNIDFAHRSCNASKGTKTLEEYREWKARLQQAS